MLLHDPPLLGFSIKTDPPQRGASGSPFPFPEQKKNPKRHQAQVCPGACVTSSGPPHLAACHAPHSQDLGL